MEAVIACAQYLLFDALNADYLVRLRSDDTKRRDWLRANQPENSLRGGGGGEMMMMRQPVLDDHLCLMQYSMFALPFVCTSSLKKKEKKRSVLYSSFMAFT